VNTLGDGKHRPETSGRTSRSPKQGDRRGRLSHKKGSLSHIGGYTILGKLSDENFNESGDLRQQLEQYQELFGRQPPWVVGDRIYGTQANRNLTKEKKIRDAFIPLGRKAKASVPPDRWRRQKHRERNRIEGAIGHGKNHYGLDRIKYCMRDSAELWIRLGLMAANLNAAVKKA